MSINVLRQVDINAVDREKLTDITQVRLKQELHGEERILDYLEKVGDPHLFRVGKTVVRASYTENGPSLSDLLKELILSA